MCEVTTSDAKTHFSKLLTDVERGKTVIITRHGRAVARLVPETDRRQEEVASAITGILELRKHTGKISIGELISATHEGHRY